jgi:hypothetical protein
MFVYLDSGFRYLDCEFRYLDSGFRRNETGPLPGLLRRPLYPGAGRGAESLPLPWEERSTEVKRKAGEGKTVPCRGGRPRPCLLFRLTVWQEEGGSIPRSTCGPADLCRAEERHFVSRGFQG